VDAYPAQPFKATVALIGHQSVKVNNVISYLVTLEPLKVPGELRAGMTANVNFILMEKKGVLTLPNFVVKGKSNATVELKVPGADKKNPETRSVALGLADDAKVEVLSGLEEGDKVLVSALDLPKALSGGMGSWNAGGQKPGGGGQGGQGGGGQRGMGR
jgi:multidrug efflux pump subunit AcrA (membrane-fusion protein)